MIAREEMAQLLIEACPSFRAHFEELVAEWADEPEDLPDYLVLEDLAIHLIDLLEHCNTESFAEVFDVVERLHVDGDAYVREAATVGLLEDLQNVEYYKTGKPEHFEPFLKAESTRWWKKVRDFWEKGRLMTDD